MGSPFWTKGRRRLGKDGAFPSVAGTWSWGSCWWRCPNESDGTVGCHLRPTVWSAVRWLNWSWPLLPIRRRRPPPPSTARHRRRFYRRHGRPGCQRSPRPTTTARSGSFPWRRPYWMVRRNRRRRGLQRSRWRRRSAWGRRGVRRDAAGRRLRRGVAASTAPNATGSSRAWAARPALTPGHVRRSRTGLSHYCYSCRRLRYHRRHGRTDRSTSERRPITSTSTVDCPTERSLTSCGVGHCAPVAPAGGAKNSGEHRRPAWTTPQSTGAVEATERSALVVDVRCWSAGSSRKKSTQHHRNNTRSAPAQKTIDVSRVRSSICDLSRAYHNRRHSGPSRSANQSDGHMNGKMFGEIGHTNSAKAALSFHKQLLM